MDQLVPDEMTAHDEVISDDVAINDDPRHQKRVALMQALFAYSFSDQQAKSDEMVEDLTKSMIAIKADEAEIDAILQTAAPERPLSEINKVDLAILRVIVFESRHKKTPKKVLINEAIELAKEFGTDSSSAFVNAVLGKLLIIDQPSN